MPNTASRRVVGIVLVAFLVPFGPLGGQAPADTLAPQAEPSGSVAAAGGLVAPYRVEELPPEFDPGADRHFLLPSGRVAPHGTGSAGLGGLAFPTLAAPFVSGSPLPRVSVSAATMLALLPDPLEMPVVGSVSVQPMRYGMWDGSVTAIGYTAIGRGDVDLAAVVATVSYGTDTRRVTGALGSLGPLGRGYRFATLAWDIEVKGGEPETIVVAGEARTVRERLKLVGELYTPLADEGFSGFAGLVGMRFSDAQYWVNLGVPVAIDRHGGGGAWIPIISFGVAF